MAWFPDPKPNPFDVVGEGKVFNVDLELIIEVELAPVEEEEAGWEAPW